MSRPPTSRQKEVKIRPAQADDAEAIGRAHAEGWDAAYRGIMSDEAVDAFVHAGDHTTRWNERMEEQPDGRVVWVAEVDGEVVGFAQTGPSRQPDAGPPSAGPRIAELYCIYLGAGAIGSGIGRRLLGHAVDDLSERGYDCARLWVLEANSRARRFYEAAGWYADGATRVDPGDGCTDVRYSLSLLNN